MSEKGVGGEEREREKELPEGTSLGDDMLPAALASRRNSLGSTSLGLIHLDLRERSVAESQHTRATHTRALRTAHDRRQMKHRYIILVDQL